MLHALNKVQKSNILLQFILIYPTFVCMPQNDVDGKAYYAFEFTAQAPNYIRHALGVVTVGNGMKLITTCEFEVHHFSFLARSL